MVGHNRIQSFDASLLILGSGIGQMSYPHYISLHCVCGEDCLIFVTDSNNNRVLAFNARTGSVVRTLAQQTTKWPTELSDGSIRGVGGALLVVSD